MGALGAATARAVDRFWAGWLGCPADALRPPATLVFAHGPGLAGYDGTFVLLAGGAPVVSLPPALLAGPLGEAARGWSAEQVRAPTALALAHRPHADVGQVVGPAWVGYADAATLAAPRTTRGRAAEGHARPLTAADAPALAALRDACGPEAWEHGGHALADGPAAGAFADGRLAAVAGYARWGERLAHVSVVTHPDYRGRALGRAAVARVAALALARGLVPQYRTLESNAPARALAGALGFTAHLTTVAARHQVG